MVAKLDYLHDKQLTPADALRQRLGSLEDRVPSLKRLGRDEVLGLLADLDDAYFKLAGLAETGFDLTAELARWQVIEGGVRKQAAALLDRLGGLAGLQAIRPEPPPATDQWWWYLDGLVAERRRHRRQRMATAGGAVLVLVLGLIVLFRTVLKPDPGVLARIEQTEAAMIAFGAGEYGDALEAVDEGLRVAPDDVDLLLLKGIILDALGRSAEAGQVFDRVETGLGPTDFFLYRGQQYFQLGNYEAALQDARKAVEADPESAESWFLVGLASQNQGDRVAAAEAYRRAADLADAQGNSALFAQVRINLANLANAGPP
ncbi:MAG: tetratricopeptide repeat protein [Anaerolineae bacterium]